MSTSVQAFFIAFSALFSIVSPISQAIIYVQVTGDRSRADRALLARRIALYAGLVMLGALWAGAPILGFFGVSLAALRIAGGFVVAFFAWQFLQAPERGEERKQEQAEQAEGIEAVAFYPLTLPFTTGPGTISVAVTLGSTVPAVGAPGFWPVAIGSSLAPVAVAATIWLSYASGDRLVAVLGRAGARVVSRLTAFLLLCVGVQIALNGIAEFVRSI